MQTTRPKPHIGPKVAPQTSAHMQACHGFCEFMTIRMLYGHSVAYVRGGCAGAAAAPKGWREIGSGPSLQERKSGVDISELPK